MSEHFRCILNKNLAVAIQFELNNHRKVQKTPFFNAKQEELLTYKICFIAFCYDAPKLFPDRPKYKQFKI